jgi:hypothetical protein
VSNLFRYFCPACGALFRDINERGVWRILHRGVQRSDDRTPLPTSRCVPYHDYVAFSPCRHCCPDVFRHCQACRLGYPGALDPAGRPTEAACDCHYCLESPTLTAIDAGRAKDLLQEKRAAGTFDVFLCHSSTDKPAVRSIADQLQGEGVLPWLDEREIRPGSRWQKALAEQITRIRAAAVFLGPTTNRPWQDAEIEALLDVFVHRGSMPIPVILAGGPDPDAIPLFLRAAQVVDFRLVNPDPLSLLIWGVTGVRRDRHHGQPR